MKFLSLLLLAAASTILAQVDDPSCDSIVWVTVYAIPVTVTASAKGILRTIMRTYSASPCPADPYSLTPYSLTRYSTTHRGRNVWCPCAYQYNSLNS
jgi:hypothetical protein